MEQTLLIQDKKYSGLLKSLSFDKVLWQEGEKEYCFELFKLQDGQIILRHQDGEQFHLSTEGELFALNGEVFEVKSFDSQINKAKTSKAQDQMTVVAPMPGKILKVFVQEGEEVQEGSALLAMEAMKMEHVMKASSQLKVKKIHCKEGDLVSAQALLVETKASES